MEIFSHKLQMEESVRQNENVIFTRLCGMPAHVCVFEKMKLKLLFLQTVLHLIVWYAGPGQNNNANFDTDVEAGGASEDENQVRKMVRRMLMMVMVLLITIIIIMMIIINLCMHRHLWLLLRQLARTTVTS